MGMWGKTRRALLAGTALVALLLAMPARALTLGADQGLESAVSLAGALAELRDGSGALTLADIISPGGDARFAPLPGYVANGFTQDTIWIRFTLSRKVDAPVRWMLEATPPVLDEVTLYAPDGRSGFTVTRLGDQLPYADRPVRHRNFIFPVQVDEAPAVFYLRVKSTSTLHLQLRLRQSNGMVDSRAAGDISIGVVIGALGIMLLFNLVFWVWLRDRTYLYYALYLASTGAALVFFGGYAARWLPTSPWLADQGVGIAVTLNCATATLFIRHAMNLRTEIPWVGRALEALFWAFCAMVAASLLGLYYPLLPVWAHAGALAVVVAATLSAGWLLLRGRREYLLYVLAFSVFSGAYLFTLLRAIGWYDLGDFIDPLYQGGLVVHLVLLNVALAHRVRATERRTQADKQRALDIALHTERELENKVQDALTSERLATEQQRQFVTMVSHEFRTPLAIIHAVSQSLSISGAANDPQVRERIGKIDRAVDRLSALIDNYLAEDKLSMDEVPLEPRSMNLRDTLDESVRALAEHAGGRLRVLAAGEMVPVTGDPPLLAVALNNLIQNALKYSPFDSPVEVYLHVDGSTACLDVHDAGRGIASQEQERVFDKYYRSAQTGQVAGSGLGLYLARVILQRHGGNVQLLETGPRGSVFRMELPLRVLD